MTRHDTTEPGITPVDLARVAACPETESARLHRLIDDLHLQVTIAKNQRDRLQERLDLVEHERDRWKAIAQSRDHALNIAHALEMERQRG